MTAPEATMKPGCAQQQYTRWQRTWMSALDAMVATFGRGLALGGRPLKRLLVQLIGTSVCLMMRDKRRIAMINLDLVYGDSLTELQKRRITRLMFVHFSRLAMDFIFDYVYWAPAVLRDRIQVEGFDAVEEALAGGRGFLGISGHIGNWEMMCAAAAAHGYDFFGIYKRAKNVWFDRYVGRKRLRYGMNLIEVPMTEYEVVNGQRRALRRRSLRRDLEKAWQDNRGVAYLCDQHPGRKGSLGTFLGVAETPTADGLLHYAIDNRIPLTFHCCVYQPDGRLRYRIHGPIEIVELPDGRSATIDHYLGLVNDWLSRQILETPEQWSWGHRRFARHLYAPPRPPRGFW